MPKEGWGIWKEALQVEQCVERMSCECKTSPRAKPLERPNCGFRWPGATSIKAGSAPARMKNPSDGIPRVFLLSYLLLRICC